MRLVRGGKIKRKPTMAPTTFSSAGPRGSGNSRCSMPPGSSGMSPGNASGFFEGGHQLEKLEFALAIAETKGDQKKSLTLRKKIVELGGNSEEPGT